MPKTITNSKTCATCARFMPMKSTKRHTCSSSCETEFRRNTKAQRKRTRRARALGGEDQTLHAGPL